MGIELEGAELKEFNDFISGVSAALVDNSTLIPSNYRVNRAAGKDPSYFKAGETVGDLLSIVQGGLEIVVGGGEAAVTTAGVVTAPAAAVGGAIVLHGGAVIGKATTNLTSRTYNSEGSAKRRFSQNDRNKGFEKSKDTEGVPRCEYCGDEMQKGSGSPKSYEADHTKAYSKGGKTKLENLTPSCRDCNRSKGKKDLGTEWIPPKNQN